MSVVIELGNVGKLTVEFSMLVVLGCESESNRNEGFSDSIVPHA